MGFGQQIRKISGQLASRAKYDDFLYLIMQIGAGALAVSAPALAPVAIYINALQGKEKAHTKQGVRNSFYYFLRKGLICTESRDGVTYVELTKEGERRARLCGAGKILLNNIKQGHKKWDGKWSIVFFDLKNEKNTERNAIRHLLQRCGFVFLQKSVWIYPHDCSSEIDFLRSFFRLSEKEFRLVICTDVGEVDYLKKHFQLLQLV